MEVYIDDILEKSIKVDHRIKDLEEAFNVLMRHRMKLNLRKYAFDIILKIFLGFMVTSKKIKANL